MPYTSFRAHTDLLVYYGHGELPRLLRHRRVALQPDHYSAEELAELAANGTQALAYLSLGEDPGPPAPWQLPDRNPDWGGSYVEPGHEEWATHVRRQAEAALARGFAGLMLDTLETPPMLAGPAQAIVSLVSMLREVAADGYVLANRAYPFLNHIAPFVDGFLFEAFSTTWQGGYSALRGRDLLENTVRLRALYATGRDVYALDYSDRPSLTAFATSRAENLGLRVQVTNKEVTALPE